VAYFFGPPCIQLSQVVGTTILSAMAIPYFRGDDVLCPVSYCSNWFTAVYTCTMAYWIPIMFVPLTSRPSRYYLRSASSNKLDVILVTNSVKLPSYTEVMLSAVLVQPFEIASYWNISETSYHYHSMAFGALLHLLKNTPPFELRGHSIGDFFNFINCLYTLYRSS